LGVLNGAALGLNSHWSSLQVFVYHRNTVNTLKGKGFSNVVSLPVSDAEVTSRSRDVNKHGGGSMNSGPEVTVHVNEYGE